MDVYCTTCREPWDTHHLWQDAIHETDLDETETACWLKLPGPERLRPKYRQAFAAAGYIFGTTVLNVIRCPGCPPNAKAPPDLDLLNLKSDLEFLLADDGDGLASEFSNLGQ